MLTARAICLQIVANSILFSALWAVGIFTSALHLYSPPIYMTNLERVAIFAVNDQDPEARCSKSLFIDSGVCEYACGQRVAIR
jgi:hypothetical protein